MAIPGMRLKRRLTVSWTESKRAMEDRQKSER
jgi:hypothetical protein